MEQIELKKEVLAGKIFIYPTDTVYGLGCDATNRKAVEKIREIKARDKDKPLSIIAPSIKWIKDNLIIDCELGKYLPGPYTIILKKKNPSFLSHVSSAETIGVRIPDSKFCDRIRKAGIPFITTSVNLSGEKPANLISEISEEIINAVDYVIDEGELSGKSSILIIKGKEAERK
jgi:L-threonylcarbamoyladenylate synthase